MSHQYEENTYTVVLNAEEQYSIWPIFKEVPPGWQEVGFRDTKERCLDHIKEVWQDMRPLSLRKKMKEREENWEHKKSAIINNAPLLKPSQSKMVSFLSQGSHPVSCGSIYESCQALKEAIMSRHVHLIFTDTQGQTCLSIPLNPQKTCIDQANFEVGSGKVVVVGNLVLDFIRVECLATIFLPSLEGDGTITILN